MKLRRRVRLVRRELSKVDFPNAERVKKNFGERIRAARIEAQLTQEQLGEMAGISRGLLNHYEAGRNFPSLTVCIVLFKTLKLDTRVVELAA